MKKSKKIGWVLAGLGVLSLFLFVSWILYGQVTGSDRFYQNGQPRITLQVTKLDCNGWETTAVIENGGDALGPFYENVDSTFSPRWIPAATGNFKQYPNTNQITLIVTSPQDGKDYTFTIKLKRPTNCPTPAI